MKTTTRTLPHLFVAASWLATLPACTPTKNEPQPDLSAEVKPADTVIVMPADHAPKQTFEERQDSLRQVLLQSKSDENLKSSLLQELYIRGLVNTEGDSITFVLPFDLHGFDCGAPDCYSTDLSFKILAQTPVAFPDTIEVEIFEHGCIDEESKQKSMFALSEQTRTVVNYYSQSLKSNLIVENTGQLLYYPHNLDNSVSAAEIDKMFSNPELESSDIVPYQCTAMTANEYELFLDQ